MRGAFADQGGLFSYISPEARVPAEHPLRKIRELVRDVLSEMSRDFWREFSKQRPLAGGCHKLQEALVLQGRMHGHDMQVSRQGS
jgi:hypothetical protein